MKIKIGVQIIAMYVIATGTLVAQTVSTVPADVANDRFMEEYHSVIRPGLSLNGFDNTGSTSRGLGLKQVLNAALSGDTYIKSKLNNIFEDAKVTLTMNNLSNDDIEENSRILQYTAFEALASYVLEENGIDPGDLNMRDHDDALTDLKQKLLFISSYTITPQRGGISYSVLDEWMVSHKSDYVHNVKSFQNIARAVDLYLALENAYKQWDYSKWLSSSVLLNYQQKQELNITLRAAAERMYNWLYKHHALGVQEFEVEPGNRPLKGFLSMGYAALAVQNPFDHSPGTSAGNQERQDFDNLFGTGASDVFSTSATSRFNEAKNKASEPATNSNCTKFWMYQSNEGEREWAEGPFYLDFALADAIPFWHAVRINGLLGEVSDPFKGSNKWFLNPVEWLADLSTPDGFIPPIDDGNKSRYRVTDFLRWTNTYGEPQVGGKFATIHSKTLKYYSSQGQTFQYSDYQYLIDIAIPKRSVSATVALPDLTDASGQLFIKRYTDASDNEHYILFNKEHGRSISRGEGHEQPDQMQLLYYINDDSYLSDGGYDSGDIFSNSSWNGYFYNNVMHYSYQRIDYHLFGLTNAVSYQNSGGLNSPRVSISKARKESIHENVINSTFNNIISNKVNVIEGEVRLHAIVPKMDDPDEYTIYGADYKRRIVLILDESPYIVDFNNMEETINSSSSLQKMHYHGNSNYLTNKPNIEEWSYWEISNNNPIPYHNDAKNLYISAISENQIDNQESSPGFYYDFFQGKKRNIQEFVNRDAVGNKEPYQIERKMYAHSNDDKEFGLIIFIKASDQAPSNSLQQLNVGANIHAGYYEHGNYLDFAILRHNSSGTQNIEFTKDGTIISLNLQSGKDYGFARLKKQNGIWKIDNDYKVNITQPGYFYTSNHTVGNHTYNPGSTLYVGDWVTLKFSGTVNLDNAEVFLGKYAKIEVTGSGTLTADNTYFKRLNPGDMHNGVRFKYADGNQMTNSSVTGGYYGVYMSESTGNTITNSSFSNNLYGLSVYNNSEVEVQGGSMNGNSREGIRIYNSDVYLSRPPGSHTIGGRTDIKYNGNHGINMYNHGYVWIKEANIEFNGSHEIRLDNTSRAYVGNSNLTSITGNNKFKRNGSKYIYNLAMTGSGETTTNWIVKAYYNYWGYGGAPSSGEFYGPVHAYYHLTEDPTVPPGHGNVQSTPGNKEADSAPFQVLSAAQSRQAAEAASNEEEEEHILHVRQELMRLQRWMNDKPEDPENARWLRSYSSLLHFVRKDQLSAERQEMHGRKNHWLARYHVLNSLSADSLREREQQAIADLANAAANSRKPGESVQNNGPNIADVSNLVGEVAVLLEIEEALHRKELDRVLTLYDKYGPAIQNTDNQYGLLGALAIAYQGKKEFGEALGAIQQQELLRPDQEMAEGFEAPDLSDLKAMLEDSALAHNQDIQFTRQTPGQVAQQESMPDEFKLASAYPNPFNPATTIAFEVPGTGTVRIEVFDISGRLVSVLTNQSWQAGRHQLTFNAQGLASGVYLVRAQYGGLTDTRKITLVK